MINGLDLFSGIGGLSLALSPWVRTVAYCEIDRYAQSVLMSRMSERDIQAAPIWSDVSLLLPGMLPGNGIDIIYGGFPCQDISVAGNGKGLDGERSGLFFEITRLVSELRPRFVFLENVPAITTRGGVRVISEFTKLGYDCRWTIVSAAELGAPHLRKRWFLLANANGMRRGEKQVSECGGENQTESGHDGKKKYMADSASSGLERERERCLGQRGWWSTEPSVGRMVNGLPRRVDRIKGLGNAVVPAQARQAFERMFA